MGVQHFNNWVEGKANALRAIVEVPPFGRLDPFALASEMKVGIVRPIEITGLHEDTLPQLLNHDASAWSAGTLHLPDGRTLVVMNPTHNGQRQRSSLMEELAHVYLEHKPSQIMSFDGFAFTRSYNKTHETQAIWFGAAALLPRRVIKGAKTLGWAAEKVADDHGVSVELVTFRQKTLGIRL